MLERHLEPGHLLRLVEERHVRFLTELEMHYLAHIKMGCTNAELADLFCVTEATFSLTYDSSPYGPYQATVGLANLDVLGIPYPGATWTYTAPGDIYNINGAQSLLNSTWTWNTTGYFNVSMKSADVLTVILHEMGHWMFLNHPCATQPGAVMCSQPVAKWNLTNDDIQGMQALYY